MQGHWSLLPCPPEDLSNPQIEPISFMSPALAGRFFTASATWESHLWYMQRQKDGSQKDGWAEQERIRSDQLLSHVRLFVTPWIAARQASLSITSFRSSLRLTSIESVMPSSHLILCCPLLLLPTIRPSIRVFSNESQVYSITSEDFSIKKQKHWYRVCLSYDKRQLVWGYNNQIALSINKIYRPHLYF